MPYRKQHSHESLSHRHLIYAIESETLVITNRQPPNALLSASDYGKGNMTKERTKIKTNKTISTSASGIQQRQQQPR